MLVKLTMFACVVTAFTFLSLSLYADTRGKGGYVNVYSDPAIASDLPLVRMMMSDTQHYPLLPAVDGASLWSSILPSTGAVVSDITTGKNRTVAMFHQLQCLDLIRQDFVARRRKSSIGRHCLNYLRQSLLCHSETRLETVSKLRGPGIVDIARDYDCKDWTALYAAVTRETALQ